MTDYERLTANPKEEFAAIIRFLSGDWRNYFNWELGEDFEATFPQLLSDLGNENGSDWQETLPAKLNCEGTRSASGEGRVEELYGKLAAHEDGLTEWDCGGQPRKRGLAKFTS